MKKRVSRLEQVEELIRETVRALNGGEYDATQGLALHFAAKAVMQKDASARRGCILAAAHLLKDAIAERGGRA